MTVTSGAGSPFRRAAIAPSSSRAPSISASTPLVVRRDVAFADRAQVAFHLVGEQLALAMLDHARDALEGMKAAEQLLGDHWIRTVMADRSLEREQAAPDHGQVFFALGKVVVEKAVEEVVHRPDAPCPAIGASSVAASLARPCGANGFVM